MARIKDLIHKYVRRLPLHDVLTNEEGAFFCQSCSASPAEIEEYLSINYFKEIYLLQDLMDKRVKTLENYFDNVEFETTSANHAWWATLSYGDPVEHKIIATSIGQEIAMISVLLVLVPSVNVTDWLNEAFMNGLRSLVVYRNDYTITYSRGMR